jgi:N-acyl-D-amino-acid deacylase
MIDDANREGLDVTADQYPYTASMTHLNVCIPPNYFTQGIAGMVAHLKNAETRARIRAEILAEDSGFENQVQNCGGFDGVFISRAVKTPEVEGQTIGEYARKTGKDSFDVLFDTLIANEGVVSAIYFAMCEEDVFRILMNEHVVIGTDGIVKSAEERAHPRAYGTFPRAINYFVKEKGLLTLEEMIRKMTSKSAEAAMIQNKGVIRAGYDADLVVFNYDTIRDTADFIHSNRLAEGIEYVIVGGEVVYEDHHLTGATPGKVLLHS